MTALYTGKILKIGAENKALEVENEGTRMLQGTLIRGIGSFYTALDGEGNQYTLRCKKKFRRQGISPLTGDEVMFSPGTGEEHGWIEEILPRKTFCLRPPVANVTRLVIVLAPVPEPDLTLADRMISRAVAQQIEILLAVNKTDLDPTLADRIREEYRAAGFPVFPVSGKLKTGLLPDRTERRGKKHPPECPAGTASGNQRAFRKNRPGKEYNPAERTDREGRSAGDGHGGI